MKNLFIGLFALISIPVFAADLSGLNCSTKYVLHEVSRTPYETDRIVIRKSLLGGRSVLGYIPMTDVVQNFRDEFNLDDPRETISYSFDVQAEKSFLSIKVMTNQMEVTLLDHYEFLTEEGFTEEVSLFEMIQIGTQRAVSVAVSCRPVYREIQIMEQI